jgi:hypothetical protein
MSDPRARYIKELRDQAAVALMAASYTNEPLIRAAESIAEKNTVGREQVLAEWAARAADYLIGALGYDSVAREPEPGVELVPGGTR